MINSCCDFSGIKSYIFSCFKVIAQGIATLLKLGNKLSDDKILMMRLVTVAKDNLKDTSHQVKCRCLQLISELYPIIPELDRTTEMISEANAIVKLLGDYSNAEVSYVLFFLDLDCFLICSRVSRGNFWAKVLCAARFAEMTFSRCMLRG